MTPIKYFVATSTKEKKLRPPEYTIERCTRCDDEVYPDKEFDKETMFPLCVECSLSFFSLDDLKVIFPEIRKHFASGTKKPFKIKTKSKAHQG